MRTICFVDEDGNNCIGTNFENGFAHLLKNGAVSEKKLKVCKILPPLEPSAIFCIGLNYAAHAKETGQKLPDRPIVFMKNPASVIGCDGEIVLPASCRSPLQVDYEVELAIIIGKIAKNVSAENALDYVAGYTIANDVSARRWQKIGGNGQWVRGKSFDTFCPIGPEVVMTDEIADPNNLSLKTVLNGEIMQESNTSDMIFSVEQLIEYLSEDTTLLPGTLILTGTPEGVGFTRDPAVYLKPGDKIEMTIGKLGTLVNTVI